MGFSMKIMQQYAFKCTLRDNCELSIAQKALLCYCNQMLLITNWDLHYLDLDLYKILNKVMSLYLGNPEPPICVQCVST